MRNIKVATDLVLLEIANCREAAQLCDAVIELIKRFDGKVLNIKFEKALKEVTGKIFSVKKNYIMENYTKQFEIEWHLDNRSVKSGEYSVEYLSECSKNVCYIYVENFEDAPIQNKRIAAKNIIPHIQATKKHLLEKAVELEESINKVEGWKKRNEEIKKMNNKLYDEIPYLIRDYFELDIKFIY